MSSDYKIFWGDTHHNTYQQHVQDPPLTEILEYAGTSMDFYTGAYYTPIFTKATPLEAAISAAPEGGHPSERLLSSEIEWKGVDLEDLKDKDTMAREWAEFQEVTRDWNRPGEFVAFPGYEWQGNGRHGDHNVVYKSEGEPLHAPDSLSELYNAIRGSDAIAIPHHTGYYVDQRAPTWSDCDETISPFAEVYSTHGCSETDEELIGLRANSHMGPGVGGGTYQDALNAGLHIGAICSTDNWDNVPGKWNQGIAACLAKDLSRESLWEAFLARRVYGVTGDRIKLNFTCNGQPMGSVMDHAATRELHVDVEGMDAIDRIELLKNGRVIATHCHQGTWEFPEAGRRSRFKFRVEPGWGPRLGEIPLPEYQWRGELRVAGGKMLAWSPCWIARGQGVPQLEGEVATFEMVSLQKNFTGQTQGATVFEFEADPSGELSLRLNGMEAKSSVSTFGESSRLLWYRDECVEFVREQTGVEPETAKRGDVYYQQSCKAKLHRLIPEAGYTATLEFVDEEPIDKEVHYRVRIEQRNGQRAWSSPIWVAPAQ